MATYPFMIKPLDQPPYWHDFDFATSGEALTQAQAISVSGDVITETEGEDEITVVYPAHAINGIRIHPPKD